MSDVEKTEFQLPEGFSAKAPSPVDANVQADEHDIEPVSYTHLTLPTTPYV